jgi:hypothetical protein
MPEVSYPTDPARLRVMDVLLVEDDPGDVLMTREAFEASRLPSTLHVVAMGSRRCTSCAGPATSPVRPGRA